MGIATDILKAKRVGIRDIKEHLTSKLLNKVLVITDRGDPVSVTLPYSDVLELLDIIDEVTDLNTIATVAIARKAVREGTKGIPSGRLFKKIRGQHK